jgi:hypothetical protein
MKTPIFAIILLAASLPGIQTKQAAPAKQPASQTKAAAPQTLSREQALNYFAQATIGWEKANTPGMRAEMLSLEKGVKNGKPVAIYKIKVTGAPPLKKYSLEIWPITYSNPGTVMEGLMIDPQGRVGCPAHSADSCSKSFDGSEISLSYSPTKGEIYRNALISTDKKTRVFFSVVPDPIIGREGACSLEVLRLQPAFELALIHGRGFKAGEPVAFHSQSFQEVHDVEAKADQQGQFWVPFTPYIEGKTSGTTSVTGKSAACSPTVSFNWGPA